MCSNATITAIRREFRTTILIARLMKPQSRRTVRTRSTATITAMRKEFRTAILIARETTAQSPRTMRTRSTATITASSTSSRTDARAANAWPSPQSAARS